jgi:flagellar FliL protein
MAEEENSSGGNSGGGKGLLIVLIVLIVLLIGIVAGGFIMFKDKIMGNDEQSGEGAENSEKTVKKKKKADSGEDMFKADVNDLVLNVTDAKGRGKLMKLSFTIKGPAPTIGAIVESVKPEIIDVVIEQISSRTSEELMTVGGKNIFREELRDGINKVINESAKSDDEIPEDLVHEIYFTAFVIK